MIIFQTDTSEIYGNIILFIIIALVLLAVVIWLNFIYFKPKELKGIFFVLFKILPTIVLSIGIIFLSIGALDEIHKVSSLNNDKYLSVQGNIEDLIIEEAYVRGDPAIYYDCSFVVDGVEFPFSNYDYYTVEEAQSLKDANENEDIVKVSYFLDRKSKEPIPFKVQVVETQIVQLRRKTNFPCNRILFCSILICLKWMEYLFAGTSETMFPAQFCS